MGYTVYENPSHRWAGYGVPAICDQPECGAEIDRGLSYRCEECGLFFCHAHLYIGGGDPQMCVRCCDHEPPFDPKPDTTEWNAHILTDESWKQWRDENPAKVAELRGLGNG